MDKRVLVIPNDDNELNDFIEEIWDRVNQDTARDFIRSKALPGPLLASFEAETRIADRGVMGQEQSWGYVALPEIMDKQPVTVLILGGKK